GPYVRDLIHRADRVALGEARRIFTNSSNVKHRLERSLGLAGEVLYHRSPLCSRLLREDEGEIGDYVLYPSRVDRLKRQGWMVVDPDPPAIAAAFDQLRADPALAEKMGRAGRQGMEDQVPDWPAIVERLLG